MKNWKFLLFLLVAGINSNTVFSQSNICICFIEMTEYIEYSVSEDSVRTSFSIINKGYETEELRKKALDEYNQNLSEGKMYSAFTPYDAFITNYMSVGKPENLISIEDVNCALIITVEDFRKQNFEYPPGTGGSQVIFIEKISDNNFLKWNAIKMALE